jgi:drug/metabolite transporter (DMT)-like permease
MSALLAAVAAAGYAASDVTSARAVRRVRPAAVALWAHVVATVLLLGAGLLTAAPPSAGTSATALAAGFVAGAGAVVYYAGLKRGAASLLAPIAASGLVLPVTVGVLRGERTVLLAGLGTVVLLAGVAVLARARGENARADPVAIGLGLLGAAGFGSYFVVLDAASSGADPLWIAGLVTTGSALAAVPALLRNDGLAALLPPAGATAALVAVGLFLAVADLALAAAMAKGDVALVSVISSSDPVLTVVAARVLLEERISRQQAAGVALALSGVLAVAAA